MSFANKFNRSKSINWGISTEGFSFERLSTLEPNTIYRVFGFIKTPDNGYGPGSCVILSDRFVNLPASWVSDVDTILADPEAVADIIAGRVGISYRMGKSKKYNRDMYIVEFVDI